MVQMFFLFPFGVIFRFQPLNFGRVFGKITSMNLQDFVKKAVPGVIALIYVSLHFFRNLEVYRFPFKIIVAHVFCSEEV